MSTINKVSKSSVFTSALTLAILSALPESGEPMSNQDLAHAVGLLEDPVLSVGDLRSAGLKQEADALNAELNSGTPEESNAKKVAHKLACESYESNKTRSTALVNTAVKWSIVEPSQSDPDTFAEEWPEFAGKIAYQAHGKKSGLSLIVEGAAPKTASKESSITPEFVELLKARLEVVFKHMTSVTVDSLAQMALGQPGTPDRFEPSELKKYVKANPGAFEPLASLEKSKLVKITA